MVDATYFQSSFLGGEISPSAQGRFDLPTYRTSMAVCLNGLPMETGSHTRRPGTQHCGPTRSGAAGRIVSFDFEDDSPYNIEFTDGHIRFWNGPQLVTTNDDKVVSAISTANPAVVQTSTVHNWSNGDQVFFQNLGANNPLLQKRVFSIIVIDTTHFSIASSVGGTNIDGSTLGTFVSGSVSRVLDFATLYAGGAWSSVRRVQTNVQQPNGSTVAAVFLHPLVAPQVLTVINQPSSAAFASFSLAAITFSDGPYFDPVPGGTLATPSALTGLVNLTLSYNAYASGTAYKAGDYVTYSSVNYKSLVDANLGNQPDISSTKWATTTAFDAISTSGFQGTDIGRHVRLYSQPPLWASGTTYAAGNNVTYNDVAYQSSVSSNTANQPDTSPTKWSINPTGAIWTWGKITSLLNEISRSLSGSVNIGNMTTNQSSSFGQIGAGIAAAFDGNTNQSMGQGAALLSQNTSGISAYIGKNYTGASAQVIASGTIFPSSDEGLAATLQNTFLINMTINLRAKQTSPAGPADGTLLGTTGSLTANTSAPISVSSSDQTTAWNYVWFEIETNNSNSGNSVNAVTVAEVKFFAPLGTGTSNGVVVEILGGPLLYTSAVTTWRLGLFSNTTGWPTCGTYDQGRLWLSGLVGNRVDGSVSNDPYNFAPTNPDGSVSDDRAISYTFNAPDINPIYWMEPDAAGILCGTKAGEWLVQATTVNAPLTPTSMQAHRVTKVGCANIEPRRCEHTIVFVQKFARKIMEYFADVFSGKFSAPNLSEKAKHLTVNGLVEIAYQQELVPSIWARCGDGSLIGAVYKRDSLMSSQGPTCIGHHRHTLGSARVVESISVGPSVDGTLDSLAMVTNDAVTNVRHVEIMTNIYDEGRALTNAWFLDDAVAPSSMTTNGTVSMTFNGLWYLNGKTVTVWAGGLDLGDYVVASGAVTVKFGADAGGLFTSTYVATFSTLPVVIGFTYTTQGQIVRPISPAESGARNGPALAKTRRSHRLGALLVACQGLKFGTTFDKLRTANFATPGGTPYTALQLFSGIYPLTIDDDYSFDSMLCWQVTRPYPATVAAIGANLATQDQ